MKSLQKLGGVAALYEAAAYVSDMIFYFFVVDYLDVVDPIQKVAVLVDNQFAMYAITLIIYVFFGVALVVLVLALHERLKSSAPALMQVATAFGLIWATVVIATGMIFNVGMERIVELYASDPARAATVWIAIDAVVNGLGGGVEILGGLWSLLLSWAALQSGGLPRLLNYLGIAIGVGGILTAIPALGVLGVAIFGLGQIVWFAWVGIVMLRSRPAAASAEAMQSNAVTPHLGTSR